MGRGGDDGKLIGVMQTAEADFALAAPPATITLPKETLSRLLRALEVNGAEGDLDWLLAAGGFTSRQQFDEQATERDYLLSIDRVAVTRIGRAIQPGGNSWAACFPGTEPVLDELRRVVGESGLNWHPGSGSNW